MLTEYINTQLNKYVYVTVYSLIQYLYGLLRYYRYNRKY